MYSQGRFLKLAVAFDGRTRAALESRSRAVRSPAALPLERRGVGTRHKISRAGAASARALRPDPGGCV
ncbi:unnamed protein product [Ectocarpus sp. 4 AP-2014]